MSPAFVMPRSSRRSNEAVSGDPIGETEMNVIDTASEQLPLAKPVRLLIPKGHVGPFIRDLAACHNVVYAQTVSDLQCDDFARLADSAVRFDETELLIIALRRAGIVTASERADLHDAYIRNDLGLS